MTLNRKRLVRIEDQLDDYFFEVNKDIMTIQLLSKDYIFDSITDIEQDIFDCLNPAFNSAAIAIPEYENGQKMGFIRVKVEWIDG